MKHYLIGVLALQAAVLALAQPTAGGSATQAAPAFTCGGIGEGEQERFKREAALHHALVTFSSESGAYVADVAVKVTAADGKVVAEGNCAGPLMLLDVPAPGSYRIAASLAGEQQQKDLRLGVRKPTRVSFVWKDR